MNADERQLARRESEPRRVEVSADDVLDTDDAWAEEMARFLFDTDDMSAVTGTIKTSDLFGPPSSGIDLAISRSFLRRRRHEDQ